MLIVEGSNLVGKTMLVGSLCHVANKQGYAMIPQSFGKLPDTWDFSTDYLPYVNNQTVMDRFILSEIIQGEASEHDSRISPQIYEALQMYLSSFSCMTISISVDRSFYEKHLRIENTRKGNVNFAESMKANNGFLELRDTSTFHNYGIGAVYNYHVEGYRSFPSNNASFVEDIVSTYIKNIESIDKDVSVRDNRLLGHDARR